MHAEFQVCGFYNSRDLRVQTDANRQTKQISGIT